MAKEHDDRSVEIQQLEARPVVGIRATVRTADLGEAMGERLSALSDFLRRGGARPAGPPFVRYHTFGETETDFELGIPVVEPVAGEGQIAGGELPGGSAVTTWHIGSHETLGDAYARIGTWLAAQGQEAGGAAWEVYYWIDPGQYRGTSSLPDPSTWRTQLVQPIKQLGSSNAGPIAAGPAITGSNP